jgi:hypothetical protein
MIDFNRFQGMVSAYLWIIFISSIAISLFIKYLFLRKRWFAFWILIPFIYMCAIYFVFLLDLGSTFEDSYVSLVPRSVILGFGPIAVLFNAVFYFFVFRAYLRLNH